MAASLKINVSYSQIAVFDPCMDQPFNDWSDRHVAQGFSWRRGSVSFKTFAEVGNFKVRLEIAQAFVPHSAALRIIRVPFHVPSTGRIEIASISESVEVRIEPGDYDLFFETGDPLSDGHWCVFTFTPQSSLEAEILRRDEQLTASLKLLMDAMPA